MQDMDAELISQDPIQKLAWNREKQSDEVTYSSSSAVYGPFCGGGCLAIATPFHTAPAP
jgi:hypothetical protein